MAPRLIATLLVAVMAGWLLAACGGGENPADEATKQRLESAYAALEQAAEDLPTERFEAFQRAAIKRQRAGPGVVTSTGYLALMRYLGEHELAVGVSLVDPTDEEKLGIVLSGIEFSDDTEGLTLITPRHLGHSPPQAVIEAGATFAALSSSGRIFCLGPGDEEPRECEAPSLPERGGGSVG